MRVDYSALNERLDKEFKDRDWANACEAFRYQTTRISNDIPVGKMSSFKSAKVALSQSKIVGRDREDATVGQVGFWDKTSHGHDMLSLGNDIWIGATGLGDTIVNLGGGLKVLHGRSYPAPFIGFADKVGSNPKALLLPYPPKVVVPAKGTRTKNLTVITHALSGEGWAFAPPSAAIQKRIQIAMAKRGRYSGKQNGVWGNLSVAGIQATAANVAPRAWRKQYKPGIPGYNLCVFVQEYAEKFGGFKGLKPGGGAIKGILGPNAWLGFARGLEAGLR